MKKNKQTTDKLAQEVHKTLHSLDDWEPIKANPFFYTRFEQRLKNQQTQQQSSVFNQLYVRVLQPAFLLCLIVGSIYSGVWLGNSYSQQQELLTASTVTDINTLAVEHLLGQSSSVYQYDYLEID